MSAELCDGKICNGTEIKTHFTSEIIACTGPIACEVRRWLIWLIYLNLEIDHTSSATSTIIVLGISKAHIVDSTNERGKVGHGIACIRSPAIEPTILHPSGALLGEAVLLTRLHSDRLLQSRESIITFHTGIGTNHNLRKRTL
jgi:hypothetical protein